MIINQKFLSFLFILNWWICVYQPKRKGQVGIIKETFKKVYPRLSAHKKGSASAKNSETSTRDLLLVLVFFRLYIPWPNNLLQPASSQLHALSLYFLLCSFSIINQRSTKLQLLMQIRGLRMGKLQNFFIQSCLRNSRYPWSGFRL